MAHKNDSSTNTRKPPKTAITVLVLFLVVILLAGIVFGFMHLSKSAGFTSTGEEVQALTADGHINALTINPAEAGTSKDSLTAYYKDAVAFAQQNGINTLIYKGKQGMAVYWKDKNFPLIPAFAQQENFFFKIDPLSILCKQLPKEGMQVYVEIDPYTTEGHAPSMKGDAAKLASSQASSTAFSPSDAEYQALLAHSISRLPAKYPIAGVIIDNPLSLLVDEPTINGYSGLLRSVGEQFSKQHYNAKIFLNASTGEEEAFGPSHVTSLVADGFIDGTILSIAPSLNVSQQLAAWRATDGSIIVEQPDDDTSSQVLFTAAAGENYGGAVFGSYSRIKEQPHTLANLKGAVSGDLSAVPTGFDIPQTLAINYPEQNAKWSYENIFIMGNSDPNQPLLMNGTEVPRSAGNSAFGILVPLAYGANTFNFSQNEITASVTVNRPEPTDGGGGEWTPKEDGTQEAKAGQAVRISAQIASALTDYNNMGSINETLQKGATAIVQESVQIFSSSIGYLTWAYKLTSGDWVMAYNCEWIDNADASFTGLTSEASGRGEYINFAGSGSPAAYLSYSEGDNTLKIVMHDTSFTLPDGFHTNMVSGASVAPIENGVELTLHIGVKDFWGYSIEYTPEGGTRLYLKQAPRRSNDPTKPLQGVTVLLDPGHGGPDPGAPGIMGERGPNEKHINLAMAQTIAVRLRQMGADVTLTREDDTETWMDETIAAQRELKPDFFLSIHHDSVEMNVDANQVKGMRAFYHHPYSVTPSKDYAQTLIDHIAPALGRDTAEAQWGYYKVTRVTICPSVLFEYGFVVVPSEFEAATSTDGIYAAACATADAILACVPGSDVPTTPTDSPSTSGSSASTTAAALPPALPIGKNALGLPA